MVAWTYRQNGDLTLYKNGSKVGSVSSGGNPLNDGVTNRDLGADNGRHPSLHGDLHSVVEWNETKSEPFIQRYYENS